MIEINLDMALKQERTPVGEVPEAFTKGGVKYFNELPVCSETPPNQTIMTMDALPGLREWVQTTIETFNAGEPDPKKHKRLAWKSEQDVLENPGFGSFKHAVTVNVDGEGNLINYLFDFVLWNDGAINERTGLSTPGAVVVPIEKVGDEYYVHCFWQWRPAVWDDENKVPEELNAQEAAQFVALNRGDWFLTTPGGFAAFAGETPDALAKREGMEEAGLKVEKPVFDRKNFNRANVATLLRVGYSVFERMGEEPTLKESAEKIVGKMAVRIDKFDTKDGIVSEAVFFAMRDLGLISPSPISR